MVTQYFQRPVTENKSINKIFHCSRKSDIKIQDIHFSKPYEKLILIHIPLCLFKTTLEGTVKLIPHAKCSHCLPEIALSVYQGNTLNNNVQYTEMDKKFGKNKQKTNRKQRDICRIRRNDSYHLKFQEDFK